MGGREIYGAHKKYVGSRVLISLGLEEGVSFRFGPRRAKMSILLVCGRGECGEGPREMKFEIKFEIQEYLENVRNFRNFEISTLHYHCHKWG